MTDGNDMTGSPGTSSSRWTIPVLPDDPRPDDTVCACCLKTLETGPAADRNGHPLCAVCARRNADLAPELVDGWLAMPRERRRRWITAAHETDPATGSPAEVSATEITWSEDIDGNPSAVTGYKEGNHAFGAGRFGLPVRTSWDRPTLRDLDDDAN